MNQVIIEMKAGTIYKTEFKDGTFVIDRVLNQSVPTNYGFIKDTLAEDGDPLDVFVFGPPIEVGVACNIEVIGMLKCTDQGVRDDKILAVVKGTNTLDKNYLNMYMELIKQYLKTYKTGFKVVKAMGKADANSCIVKASKRLSSGGHV